MAVNLLELLICFPKSYEARIFQRLHISFNNIEMFV